MKKFGTTIGCLATVVLASLALTGCKKEPKGVCLEQEADYPYDSCEVGVEKQHCQRPNTTFVEMESREKGQTYCSMEGYKATKGEKDPHYFTRPREK